MWLWKSGWHYDKFKFVAGWFFPSRLVTSVVPLIDWKFAWSIRNNSQIWEVTRDQNGTSSLVLQTGVIRELQILSWGRLRERDFLNTKYCTRAKRRHHWWENVVAVVNLLRVFTENVVVAKTSYQLSEIYRLVSDRERASTEKSVLNFVVKNLQWRPGGGGRYCHIWAI